MDIGQSIGLFAIELAVTLSAVVIRRLSDMRCDAEREREREREGEGERACRLVDGTLDSV